MSRFCPPLWCSYPEGPSATITRGSTPPLATDRETLKMASSFETVGEKGKGKEEKPRERPISDKVIKAAGGTAIRGAQK